MKIHSILVPVDFSVCSKLVTRQAAGLAAQLGARLRILHVGELPPGVSAAARLRSDGPSAGETLIAQTRDQLEAFTRAAIEGDAPVELEVRLGPVVPEILAEIDASGSDLVIIGTHGRTGLARVVFGSVAEGVSRGAHVPVMLIRRESRPECRRESCEWCPHEGRSEAERRMAAESEG